MGGAYYHHYPPPLPDYHRYPPHPIPPPNHGVDEVRTLFVAGLPHDVKLRELYNLFADFPGYLSSQLNSTSQVSTSILVFIQWVPTCLDSRVIDYLFLGYRCCDVMCSWFVRLMGIVLPLFAGIWICCLLRSTVRISCYACPQCTGHSWFLSVFTIWIVIGTW